MTEFKRLARFCVPSGPTSALAGTGVPWLRGSANPRPHGAFRAPSATRVRLRLLPAQGTAQPAAGFATAPIPTGKADQEQVCPFCSSPPSCFPSFPPAALLSPAPRSPVPAAPAAAARRRRPAFPARAHAP